MNRIAAASLAVLTIVMSACTDMDPPDATPDQALRPAVAQIEESDALRADGHLEIMFSDDVKHFMHFPQGHNLYTRLGSKIVAQASEKSTEAFVITFISLDLRDHQYPKNLPPPKDFTPPIDPIAIAANVGFEYVDPENNRWTGFGNAEIASFQANGTITGNFSELVLQHTDKVVEDRIVTKGNFRTRLQ